MTYLALNALYLTGVGLLAALALARGARARARACAHTDTCACACACACVRPASTRRVAAAIALTAAALLVLTIVFDSLMIAADLFRYNPAHLVGVHAWLAPVEDLAWPLAAAVGLPALWVALGARRATTPGSPGPGTSGEPR